MKNLALTTALALAFAAPAAVADRDGEKIRAHLTGYDEVPSVSTPATGEFEATISRDEGLIEYTLSYSGLQGTVQQSHIHFAQKGVNGSIVVWLCQTATTPAPAAVAGLTPICPPSGTVTGQITAANVVAAATASQMIVAGELAEVVAAIRARRAYVNVHSTPLTPGGEIRGQVGERGHEDDEHHDH